MSKKEVFEFEQIEKFISGQLSRVDTAIFLNVSERTVSRKARQVEAHGLLGIKHGNMGRRPNNKKSDLLKTHVCKLIKQNYFGYNMTHLKEILKSNNGINVSYTTLRRWCHELDLVKRRYKKQTANARKKRARMANEGFLLQMDGSPHFYVPCQEWVLIAAIDDATNDIPAAQFYSSENTFNCMDILEQVIKAKGRPWGVYVDRAGWLGGTKRQDFGEFRRACEELEIEVIFANSPQGKGRIERWFQVPQDRLVAELRTNKITDMNTANAYLKTQFLPHYWQKEKTVPPRSTETKYRPLKADHDLKEIFSMRQRRKLNYDNTFKWKNNTFQVLNPPGTIVNQYVELRFYKNGESNAFFADHKLEVQLFDPSLEKNVS